MEDDREFMALFVVDSYFSSCQLGSFRQLWSSLPVLESLEWSRGTADVRTAPCIGPFVNP